MKPKYLFLLTAAVCLGHVIKTIVRGNSPDDTFWIALLMIVVSMTAWWLERKKDKQNHP